MVLYRNVQGLIEITIATGNSFTVETDTPSWQGVIIGNDGDGIDIRIKQL